MISGAIKIWFKNGFFRRSKLGDSGVTDLSGVTNFVVIFVLGKTMLVDLIASNAWSCSVSMSSLA